MDDTFDLQGQFDDFISPDGVRKVGDGPRNQRAAKKGLLCRLWEDIIDTERSCSEYGKG